MPRKYTKTEKALKAYATRKTPPSARDLALYDDRITGASIPEIQFKYKSPKGNPITSSRVYQIINKVKEWEDK